MTMAHQASNKPQYGHHPTHLQRTEGPQLYELEQE
jgi:hypothetical protein